MDLNFNNPLGAFARPRFVTSEMVGDLVEDWSGVRSIGRAKRRRKKHPQRIVNRYIANGKCVHDKVRDVVYVHPADFMKIRDALPGYR